MPESQSNIRYFDVVLCVSRALDLLSPVLSDHHQRTAYVAACIAEELQLDAEQKRDIVVAGALHDAGAVSMSSRLALLQSALPGHECDCGEDVHRHGLDGYRLLHEFEPFANAARAIRFHHVDWEGGRGAEFDGEPVPLASHILRVADNVAILPRRGDNILAQARHIRALIRAHAGTRYREDLVAAFEQAAQRESFWLDLVSPYKEEILRPYFGTHRVALASDALYELARLLGRIIDYRSPFTVLHSANVAAAAQRIGELAGMPPSQVRILGLAGQLHDLGKLAVPPEILDKPAGLSVQEELIVRQHPYHTYRILSMVPGLEEVALYGALHHERIDGSGYPYRMRGMPFGSRVVAVADVFAALTEDRPYRAGMSWEQSVGILDGMAARGVLDGEVVALVRRDPGAFGQFVERRREPASRGVAQAAAS